MNFAELIKFFSLSWEKQVAFLGVIPENASVVNFSRDNRLDALVDLFFNSICPIDDSDGFEGVDEWVLRTGLPENTAKNNKLPFWVKIGDLATLLFLIQESPRDLLFSKQGLRGSQDWAFARRLAEEVLADPEITTPENVTTYENLLERLSDC